MPSLPFDLSAGQGVYLAAALFVAAIIRGYSGFGFSAVFIIFAALTTNPLPLIPVIFCSEIMMTAFQARGIGKHIDWRRALWLLFGSGLAIVPSVTLMASLDEAQARLAISALILLLSLTLLSGWQLRRPIPGRGNAGIGFVAGIANAAGVGGLPVAAMMTAQPIPQAVFRATMIVFLTGIDAMTVPVMAWNGLVSDQTFIGMAMAFPILVAGIVIGTRIFTRTTQRNFRRMVILLLVGLSAMNIVKVLA